MTKYEIALEIEAIRRNCRDIVVFDALCDLKRRLDKDLMKEEDDGK